MLRAGIILRKGQFLSANDIHGQQTAGQGGGRFDGIRQPSFDIRLHHQPIHHDFYRMLLVLFESDGLGQIVKIAVYPHPHISGFPGGLELLDVFALTPAHHRRQQLNPGALL